MRKFLVLIAIFLILISACKRKEVINTSILDQYLQNADSMHQALTEKYKFTMSGIYHIIDDTLLADSISNLVVLPDHILFYEFLQMNISELDDLYYQAQQEIYFTQDQLKELKEDALENNTSKIQFAMQLDSNKEMLNLLKELIDSNLAVIKSISDVLCLNSADTIP